MVDENASELPHALKVWLGVSKGMLPVRYFRSNIYFYLCQLNFMVIIRLSQCCSAVDFLEPIYVTRLLLSTCTPCSAELTDAMPWIEPEYSD